MAPVEINKNTIQGPNDSIIDNSLKRKLGEVIEASSGSGKQSTLDHRTLSISSIGTDDLSDKLDQPDSESDEDSQIQKSIKRQRREGTSELLSRAESEVDLTERHLVESDDLNLQTAVVIKSFEEPFIVDTKFPKPEEIQEHEILVENKFVGLNPIDWKGKKYRFGIYSFPWVQGRESSGVVVKRGSKVAHFEIGDEVFIASTSYRDLKTSTFQQFTVFDSRLVWKIPKNLTLKQGAAIGVGLVTAGSIVEELNLNLFGNGNLTTLKESDRKSLLVWGGSSGVGSYLIQFARIAGFEKIIAVSSGKHNAFLKTIGATHILNRFKPIDELEEDLQEIVGDEGLQIGVDVVGKDTADYVIRFLNLNRERNEVKTFVGVVSKPSKTLDPKLLENIEVKEILIKRFHEDVEYGAKLVQKTHNWLSSGEIKPQKNLKLYQGYEGISTGLSELEKYGASNEKYIVQL